MKGNLLLSYLTLSSILFNCCKDDICDKLPCNEKNISVKNFTDINFRRGMWVNTSYVTERTSFQDTTYFHTDSTWSLWTAPNPPYLNRVNNKKYVLISNSNNTGSIRNYSNWLDSATKDYRTYDWYYDEKKQILYVDFNRDFRFPNQPIVYSKFIKINDK
jgi:hypothetical protein